MDDNLVAIGNACPKCGERDADVLLIHDESEEHCPCGTDHDDTRVTCLNCKTIYTLPDRLIIGRDDQTP